MFLFLRFITINIDKEFGKEVIILKSSLTKELYSDFVSSYQVCHQEDSSQGITKPFVFITHDGGVKFITDVVDSVGGDEEIFALSVAEDGFVEFLAFQE